MTSLSSNYFLRYHKTENTLLLKDDVGIPKPTVYVINL
jgi:hypothetical protein